MNEKQHFCIFKGFVILTWELPFTSTSSAKWTLTGLDLSLALFSGVMKDDFGPWERDRQKGKVEKNTAQKNVHWEVSAFSEIFSSKS